MYSATYLPHAGASLVLMLISGEIRQDLAPASQNCATHFTGVDRNACIRFAHQVAGELAELQSGPEAWRAYIAEAGNTSVSDGIG